MREQELLDFGIKGTSIRVQRKSENISRILVVVKYCVSSEQPHDHAVEVHF